MPESAVVEQVETVTQTADTVAPSQADSIKSLDSDSLRAKLAATRHPVETVAKADPVVAEPASDNPAASGEAATDENNTDAAKPTVDVAEFESRLAKLQKQVEDKEAFIKKQAAEIGDVRKLMKTFNLSPDDVNKEVGPADWEKKINDLFATNPTAAMKAMEKAKQLQAEAHAHEAQLIKGLVTEIVPDFDTHKAKLPEVLKELRMKPEVIAEYTDKPFGKNPLLVAAAAMVAKERAEKDALKARIATMEKGSVDVAKRISQAAADNATKAKTPPIKSDTSKPTAPMNVRTANDSDLSEALRRLKRGG